MRNLGDFTNFRLNFTDIEKVMILSLKKLCKCYKIAYIPAIIISLDISVNELCQSIELAQLLSSYPQQEVKKINKDTLRKIINSIEIPEVIGTPLAKEIDCTADLECLFLTITSVKESLDEISGKLKMNIHSYRQGTFEHYEFMLCEIVTRQTTVINSIHNLLDLITHFKDECDKYGNNIILEEAVSHNRSKKRRSIIIN